MIDTVSSHWGFFVGKQTSLPWGLSWGFLESYLIWVEINTKKYLFIFLWFQAVFRNLANVHTQGTIKGLYCCLWCEESSFFLSDFVKSSSFFNSSALLLVLRGDYSGTLMIPHICHIVLNHTLHSHGPCQSECLGIQMSSLPSCWSCDCCPWGLRDNLCLSPVPGVLMHLMGISIKERKVVAAVMQYQHSPKLQFVTATTGVLSSSFYQRISSKSSCRNIFILN